MKCLRKVFMLMALAFFQVSFADNNIITLTQTVENNQLTVTPIVSFKTSDEIKEAIDNGVRIQLIVKSQLYSEKNWWFDTIHDNQKVKLEFYAFKLGQLYVAKNLETNEQVSFNDYSQLLEKGFQIVQFQFDLSNKQNLMVRARVMLDFSSLPTTMQLPVLLSNQWDVNTSWYKQKVPSQ